MRLGCHAARRRGTVRHRGELPGDHRLSDRACRNCGMLSHHQRSRCDFCLEHFTAADRITDSAALVCSRTELDQDEARAAKRQRRHRIVPGTGTHATHKERLRVEVETYQERMMRTKGAKFTQLARRMFSAMPSTRGRLSVCMAMLQGAWHVYYSAVLLREGACMRYTAEKAVLLVYVSALRVSAPVSLLEALRACPEEVACRDKEPMLAARSLMSMYYRMQAEVAHAYPGQRTAMELPTMCTSIHAFVNRYTATLEAPVALRELARQVGGRAAMIVDSNVKAVLTDQRRRVEAVAASAVLFAIHRTSRQMRWHKELTQHWRARLADLAMVPERSVARTCVVGCGKGLEATEDLPWTGCVLLTRESPGRDASTNGPSAGLFGLYDPRGNTTTHVMCPAAVSVSVSSDSYPTPPRDRRETAWPGGVAHDGDLEAPRPGLPRTRWVRVQFPGERRLHLQVPPRYELVNL